MVQIRIMTDDRERGEHVVDLLLPLLQACAALHVGEPTRLHHRGGGLRLVLDVQPDNTAHTVHVERADGESRTPTPRRRRALPRRSG